MRAFRYVWGKDTSWWDVRQPLCGCSITVFLLKSDYAGHWVSSVRHEVHPQVCFWRPEPQEQADPYLSLNSGSDRFIQGQGWYPSNPDPQLVSKLQLHLSVLQSRIVRNCAFQERSDKFLLLGNCRSHIFWKNLRTSCTSEKSIAWLRRKRTGSKSPKLWAGKSSWGWWKEKVLYVCMLLSLSPQRDCLHHFLVSSWWNNPLFCHFCLTEAFHSHLNVL